MDKTVNPEYSPREDKSLERLLIRQARDIIAHWVDIFEDDPDPYQDITNESIYFLRQLDKYAGL